MTKLEVLERIKEVLDAKCDAPADELVRLGECLVAIGEALKPLSNEDAKVVMRSVAILSGVEIKA